MKTACFGLGFAAGLSRLRRAPGSAQPPVPEQPHPREAAAPGSVCIHIHLPSLCVSAPGGAAFRASPKPQPFPGLSRCRARSLPRRRAGDVGTQERELPPPGCRAGRCPRCAPTRALPALHCRAVGGTGQGTWEGQASHPLDPRSGSLVRTPAPCLSSCICQSSGPIERCRFRAGNSGSTGLKGDQAPQNNEEKG